MKVSILVPVYGVEKYIERCARSLFEQTYQDLEIVFVNDCTPDQSIALLMKVMEDYPRRKTSVKIVNHEKNRGLAAARNTAYDNATGEFVTIVDSDDWLELKAVELLVKKQEETNADIVSGNALMYYPDRVDKLEHPLNLSKEEIVINRLGNGWHNVIWGRLIRRAIIEKNHVRAIEGCDMAEDKFQMAIISYYADSFAVCEEFIYNYERRNSYSIVSQQSKEKQLKSALQFLKNDIGIQRFFADKEIAYKEEANKQTMLYAFAVLKMMVRFNLQKHFRFVIETIDGTDNKFWPLIGWTTKGIKGWTLHNYSFVWLLMTKQRLLHFLKRKLKCNV